MSPVQRESHPLCRLKNPMVIYIWLLVGFHPATLGVQSTPTDNTQKRVWQYIEKEKKKVSCIQFKDNVDILENETNDNNTIIGISLLANGNILDLTCMVMRLYVQFFVIYNLVT